MIKVYVKVDDKGLIVDVSSEMFIRDTNGWVLIDEGEGDRFAHAQNHYFDKPVRDMMGVPRYRLVDGKAVLCGEEGV